MRGIHLAGSFIAPALAAALLAAGCGTDAGSAGSGQAASSSGTEAPQPADAAQARPEPEPAPKTPVCASCHEAQHKFWAYGGHAGIACTECHGEPGQHVEKEADPRPDMRKPGREACIDCHDLASEGKAKDLTVDERIERHLDFLDKKHVIKIDRLKIKGRCLHCHDPHMGR